MSNPFYNREFDELIDKKLAPEVRFIDVRPMEDARGTTYTTKHNELTPTPFFSPFNPVNDEILAAKNILEIGGGVGRNLPPLMEQTNAHYWCVDPGVEITKYFWDIQDHKYKDRVTLCKDFSELPNDIKFDAVIVTFVFMHIGYRAPFGQMNVTDITLEAMKHTNNECVWFVMEHEREERWQEQWLRECNITPIVYFKPGGDWSGGGVIPYPEFEPMTHRGNDHNIIIFKEAK